MKTAEKVSEKLKFKDDFDKIDFITDTIQLDLLHQLIESTDLRKTNIAKELKVSNSFVTQLFSGDKRLSLNHIASLIYHLNLEFKFELKSKEKCKVVNFDEFQKVGLGDYCKMGQNAPKYHVTYPKNKKDRIPISI